ncbi:MAG: methyltransferase domain-containing protein [Acidimicrobiales bacterium]|nr:methyltransferase domain-containing protein [Acidimicrobiales bacterium]MDP6760107.1 methyltransferase domain-containing protein [Acidimicrobiales bacterium]
MPIIHLEATHPVVASDRYSGAGHPMREVTRTIAFEGTWDADRSSLVRGIFDGLAAEWTATRGAPERALPLLDALDRGGVAGGTVIELGSGTGLVSDHLMERFDRVVAVDLSFEMLRHGVTDAPQVNADAAHLPLLTGVADALVLMNMFLFPAETARCLAPRGALVWVNSRAEDTPIHLTADEVLESLTAAGTGEWSGVASRAGEGSWCVLRRC